MRRSTSAAARSELRGLQRTVLFLHHPFLRLASLVSVSPHRLLVTCRAHVWASGTANGRTAPAPASVRSASWWDAMCLTQATRRRYCPWPCPLPPASCRRCCENRRQAATPASPHRQLRCVLAVRCMASVHVVMSTVAADTAGASAHAHDAPLT